MYHCPPLPPGIRRDQDIRDDRRLPNTPIQNKKSGWIKIGDVRLMMDDYPADYCAISPTSGGSRIFRWGGADPLGGRRPVKTYAKMKELDPVGGGHAPAAAPLDPPMTWSAFNH